MDYRIRTTVLNMASWHTRPLLFKWGDNLRDCEAAEDVYDSFEEARQEVIEMRKRGGTKDLCVVGFDENGMVRSYYPDRWYL